MGVRRRHRNHWLTSIALGVVLGGAVACAPLPDHPDTFLLKMETPDVQAASEQLIGQLQVSLSQVDLPAGYPHMGVVVAVDGERDAPAETTCQAGGDVGTGESCLALSEMGDYLQVRAITWESEAFHMYRIYVVPDEMFIAFNPVKDYVAIDVVLQPDSIAWEQVQIGIELAAEGIGAKAITR